MEWKSGVERDEGSAPFITMKEMRLLRKDPGNDKVLKRRAGPESPLARRKKCCHIYFQRPLVCLTLS
jgi:hypothetical protein